MAPDPCGSLSDTALKNSQFPEKKIKKKFEIRVFSHFAYNMSCVALIFVVGILSTCCALRFAKWYLYHIGPSLETVQYVRNEMMLGVRDTRGSGRPRENECCQLGRAPTAREVAVKR
jgi:hypothetical protein